MTINRLIELPSEKPPSVSPVFCFSPVLSLPDTPEPESLITPSIKIKKHGPPKNNFMEVLDYERDNCISQKFVPRPPSLPKPTKQLRFCSSPAKSPGYSDDFELDEAEHKGKARSPAKVRPTKTPPPVVISHNPLCLTSTTKGDTVFSSKKKADDRDSADEVIDEEITCASAASDNSDDLESGSPAYPVFKSTPSQPSRPRLKYLGRPIVTNSQPLKITSYHEPMPPPKESAVRKPWMTSSEDTPSKSSVKNATTLVKQPDKPLTTKPKSSDSKAAQIKTNTLEFLPPQPPLKPRPPPPQSSRRRELTRRRYGQVPGAGKVNKAEGGRRGRHY